MGVVVTVFVLFAICYLLLENLLIERRLAALERDRGGGDDDPEKEPAPVPAPATEHAPPPALKIVGR